MDLNSFDNAVSPDTKLAPTLNALNPITHRLHITGGLYQWLLSWQAQAVLLCTLTVVAAALRFYKLGEWGFWGDEIFTVTAREDGFNFSIWRSSLASTLIQATIRALGTSEWSARLVSALVGTISIPLLYVPMYKMIGRRAAFISLVLLAISPWHLYWSQNARFYSLLLLFYTLALMTAFIGFDEDRPCYLLLSLLFLALAARERLLALFFIPVFVSYLLLVTVLPFAKPVGLRLRNLALFFVPGVLCGAFFVAPYIRNFEAWIEGFGYSNNSPFWLLAGVVYYVGLPTICMGTAGIVYWVSKGNRAALLFGLSATIPLLILMTISPYHYTANRYAFISLTSWLAVAGMAVARLLIETNFRANILVGGVFLLLLAAPLSDDLLYYRFQNGNRDDWRAAFNYVSDHIQHNDLVVVANEELGDYYLNVATQSFATFSLEDAERATGRIWFVEDMTVSEVYPEMLNWVEAHAHQVANFDVSVQARNFKMRVHLFEPREIYHQ
jgi:hypothetical protein